MNLKHYKNKYFVKQRNKFDFIKNTYTSNKKGKKSYIRIFLNNKNIYICFKIFDNNIFLVLFSFSFLCIVLFVFLVYNIHSLLKRHD